MLRQFDSFHRAGAAIAIAAIFLVCPAPASEAGQPEGSHRDASKHDATRSSQRQGAPERRTVKRVTAGLEPPPPEHPLAIVRRYAQARYDHIARNVRDFTCVLVKRERVDDYLYQHQFLYVKVLFDQFQKEEQFSSSIYVHYLAPPRLRGRKILYVPGRNEDKMLVRRGGDRFAYVKTKVGLESELAMRESRYPITEIDLRRLAARLVEQIDDDMRVDADASNTRVQFFKNARVGERQCTHIKVVHPRRASDLDFHLANVYIDDQLHVPIRVEGYGWPESSDDPPPLLEEYTYTKLRLNVGLSESDFSPEQLD